MPPSVALEVQPRRQMTDDGFARGDPTQEVEVRFRRERADEAVQSVEKCGVLEVAPSGSSAAGGEQPFGVEREEATPGTIEPSHGSPDERVHHHSRNPDTRGNIHAVMSPLNLVR